MQMFIYICACMHSIATCILKCTHAFAHLHMYITTHMKSPCMLRVADCTPPCPSSSFHIHTPPPPPRPIPVQLSGSPFLVPPPSCHHHPTRPHHCAALWLTLPGPPSLLPVLPYRVPSEASHCQTRWPTHVHPEVLLHRLVSILGAQMYPPRPITVQLPGWRLLPPRPTRRPVLPCLACFLYTWFRDTTLAHRCVHVALEVCRATWMDRPPGSNRYYAPTVPHVNIGKGGAKFRRKYLFTKICGPCMGV